LDGYFKQHRGDNADTQWWLNLIMALRIFSNDGKNRFEEKYFLPQYGAQKLSLPISTKMEIWTLSRLRFSRITKSYHWRALFIGRTREMVLSTDILLTARPLDAGSPWMPEISMVMAILMW
jgi:hypothetical protein